MREQVSESTTNRLSLYLRFLHELKGRGVKTVSSKVLAEQFGLNAGLIRKDLAHFGDLGVRGVGYVVEDLRVALRSILGLDRQLKWPSLGPETWVSRLPIIQVFVRRAFRSWRCSIPCGEVGRLSKKGVSIYDIRELKRIAKREGITIAVIAVPAPSAQDVVNTVIQCWPQSCPEFLRRARCRRTEPRQAQERGPHRLTRELVVLSRA